MIGFILGTFYTNLVAKEYVQMSGFFSPYYLEQYKGMSLKIGDYFPYLLSVRVLPIMILFLFSVTMLHKCISGGYLIWVGIGSGVLLSTGILQMGIKGICFSVMTSVPQVFFYAPAYLVALQFSYYYPDVQWTRYKTMAFAGCFSIGIILEMYVNPVLIKWFIGIL